MYRTRGAHYANRHRGTGNRSRRIARPLRKHGQGPLWRTVERRRRMSPVTPGERARLQIQEKSDAWTVGPLMKVQRLRLPPRWADRLSTSPRVRTASNSSSRARIFSAVAGSNSAPAPQGGNSGKSSDVNGNDCVLWNIGIRTK